MGINEDDAFSFNPRICKRCDAPLFITLTYNPVSIHASVKDATQCQQEKKHLLQEFQSTHL